jgi:DNA-binding MarR family transcriptional regulator
MSLLDELGPSTIGALAQADRCSQPTMTGIVNGLADKGWVQRDPHPDDARSALVSMTPEGLQTLTAVRRRNATLVAERIEASGRSEEELATAVAVLSDVLSHH